VRIRLYRRNRATSGAGLLWIHGGGMVAGDPVMDDRLLGETVRDLGITVASVEYRRAPEHPYPAPLDDCLGGWLWLQRNAEGLGIDKSRVALGGESAGGGLAAVLSQLLLDENLPQPTALWLMCPMLDDRTAAKAVIGDRDHRIWNNRNNRFGWRSYLGGQPGSAAVPDRAVPARRADLSGLPPTWIGVAGLDLFADEDLEYFRRLRESGVPADVDMVEGAPHGFQTWGADTNLAKDYLRRARDWLSDAVAAEPSTFEQQDSNDSDLLK
jgi:acetyl esterase/lipase